MSTHTTPLYLGLMSGTSVDAIDAALVALEPTPEVISARSYPLEDALRRRIRNLGAASPLDEVASLDAELGEAFAEAALRLLREAACPAERVAAIGSHGQTAWHSPNTVPPYTLQIGDPNIIAERTGITVVTDFRRRDMACGGQGAPLVPAFHAAVFRRSKEDCAVLNLGGIANITLLPAADDLPVTGYDTGPANTLLDRWINAKLGQSYDADGAWAASGTCLPTLLERLLADDYFARPAPKSTGPEHFSLEWLLRHLDGTEAPQDVQATLLELTAHSVADAIKAARPRPVRLLVCGGGAHNTHLLKRIAAALPGVAVETTAAHGIDPDYVEACAFAWLAARTLAGKAGSLPEVTGAERAAVLGGVYYAQHR